MRKEKIQKGKLKIFLGILPGTGKKCAMFHAAHIEASKGISVVIGYAGCLCPETCLLLDGLDTIPRKKINGTSCEEPDIQAILEYRPQLVLMADLPHHCLPGRPVSKCYQDLQLLLDNGINVYITANIIQLERYKDLIRETTGYVARETIPDEILELVNSVELVDITPEKFLHYLANGKILIPSEYSEEPIRSLFEKEKIISLRKSAQRILAEISDRLQQNKYRSPSARPRLLVLIGPDIFSLQAVRRTHSFACTMNADWYALYIDTRKKLTKEEEVLLSENLTFVRKLEGKLITVSGDDIPQACLDITNKECISHIVVTNINKRYKKAIHRLVNQSGVNICVIAPEMNEKRYYLPKPALLSRIFEFGKYCLIPFTLIISAYFSLIDVPFRTNIFVIFFAFGLFSCMLVIRFRQQKRQAVDREKEANSLFLLAKNLYCTSNMDEVVRTGIENIKKTFSVDPHFIFSDNNYQLTTIIPQDLSYSESDLMAATWSFKHNEPTGRFTYTLPTSDYTFYPMEGSVGIVVIKQQKAFDPKASVFWEAYLSQIAQSIKHHLLLQIAHKNSLLNESEKLYKTLFNSISHELRIPLATIMSASEMLLITNQSDRIKKELYQEVIEATKRLNRLVENLLNMSRLESGRIAIQSDWCEMNDLFNCVIENLSEYLQPFRVDVSVPENIPLVKLDFGLMEQVLYNLVYNSTLYAYHGTTIRLKASYTRDLLVIQVTDRGPGFENGDLQYVFDKFWRYKSSNTGGLGLGLSIVKGFVEAHKGIVSVENRKNGGTRFLITLPVEISEKNEQEP